LLLLLLLFLLLLFDLSSSGRDLLLLLSFALVGCPIHRAFCDGWDVTLQPNEALPFFLSAMRTFLRAHCIRSSFAFLCVRRCPSHPHESTRCKCHRNPPKNKSRNRGKFSHPKIVHTSTTIPPPAHHNFTTKNHTKTLWKLQIPSKIATPPAKKKITLPSNISSNQTATAPYSAPIP
jgi:hypothetical protein